MTMLMGHKVQEVVFARLAADERLSARLTGIYDEPPTRARYPYLTMGGTRSEDTSLKDRSGVSLIFELNVWSDEPSQMECKELVGEVMRTLGSYRPQIVDHDCGEVVLKSASVSRQAATSGSLYMGKLSYQVQVYEAAF